MPKAEDERLRAEVTKYVAGLNLASPTLGNAAAVLFIVAALKPLNRKQRATVIDSVLDAAAREGR